MNASVYSSASAIAAQPSPSAGVSRFLALKPRLFINGEWVEARSGKTVQVFDPATGKQIGLVADAGQEDVDRAVAAARNALETGPWASMTPSGREALLWKLADLIDRDAVEFAEIESLDNGKTRFMASIVDVPGARNYFRYMAGWATKIEGTTMQTSMGPPGSKFHTYVAREPVGVVAQIVPWNFPLAMAAWKLGPALAAGCTCILKPAEQTPLSALRLGELIREAGQAHQQERDGQHQARVARARRQVADDRAAGCRPGGGRRRHCRRHFLQRRPGVLCRVALIRS